MSDSAANRPTALAVSTPSSLPAPNDSDSAETTSVTSATSERDIATRTRLDDLRIDFGRTIKNYFLVLFVLTVVIATTLIVLIVIGFFLGKIMDATVMAASVQVAFGMVLGFVCVYIGLMMTWLGIEAAYTAKGEVGSGSVALKSASPGLLFALGGMVLVAVSLHKRIEYQENAMNLVGTQDVAPESRSDVVTPIAPRTMKRSPSTSPDSVADPAGELPG